MDQCDGCGFEYELARAGEAGAQIVSGSGAIASRMQLSEVAQLRRRVEPGVWSPLEYACHVRDVLLVQRERVLTARRIERPSFDPMGRDERVEHDGYASQEPHAVARQLNDAAALLANVFSRLEPGDWDRMVMYNYPVHLERSLTWVAVHTVHEVTHHLKDIETQLS